MYILKETLRGYELIHYNEKLDRESSEFRERNYTYESAQRTKRQIIDYGLSNKWSYMVTITIDSQKKDRYQYDKTTKQLLKFLKNYKQNHDSNLKYIIVPEQHKDGAIHYHGLIQISDKHLTFKKQRQLAFIYEHSILLKSFGFNEFTKIYNHTEFVTYYISKYITKSLTERFTSQRFYASLNLDQPKKTYYTDLDIPLWLWSIAPDYENQFIKKWNLDQETLKLLEINT